MMAEEKTIRPSPSYSIRVPIDAVEQVDGRVTSIWVRGKPLLLQLSSYIRSSGEQISAGDRLRQRISRSTGSWNVTDIRLHPEMGVDQATAEVVDENGVNWVHMYLVWPHLAIYASVSWPQSFSEKAPNWALAAISTITLIQH